MSHYRYHQNLMTVLEADQLRRERLIRAVSFSLFAVLTVFSGGMMGIGILWVLGMLF